METVIWQAPNGVEFEWDLAKAQANLCKHKVPFLIACETFKDGNRLERLDSSSEHDEDRWIVLGRVGQTDSFCGFYTARRAYPSDLGTESEH